MQFHDSNFAQFCRARRRTDAQACFRRAIQLNRVAHAPQIRGRGICFRRKARYVDQAIRLAPRALVLDDYFLADAGGVIGVTFPGVGALHVPLRELGAEALDWVRNQFRIRRGG